MKTKRSDLGTRDEIRGTYLINSRFVLSLTLSLINYEMLTLMAYQFLSHHSGVVILSGPLSNVLSAFLTSAPLDIFSSLRKGILRIQFVAGLAGVEGRSGLSEFATG